jgi:atrazine chlorohydrolase/5-methylthioadenosine/S-adenosylhomocysteine deaminase/melamine deaminase
VSAAGSNSGVLPDVLVVGARVVTMDDERREIAPAFVSVIDDRIAAVGPMADAPECGAMVIDARGKAVLPGFVNAHTHAVYNLLRGGIADDRPLYDWLLNVVHPGLKAMTAEQAATAAELFCVEAIRSGITTFVDNADSARFPDLAEATLAAYEDYGVRAVYARMFADMLPPVFEAYGDAVMAKEPGVDHYLDSIEHTEAALASIEELIGRHHGRAGGRISVWPAPGVAVCTTKRGLLGAKDIARRHGTRLTIHVAESALDREQAGMSSVEYLATIGFLGPEVLAAHCVQVDAKDIRLLAAKGVHVAHNPVSNLFLASGVAPIAQMVGAGVNVAIGTDDPNCNSSVNLLSDLKFAALIQKGWYRDAAAVTAERVLEMATIDGARALGMADEIGSLEPGKKADLVTIDLRRPHLVPVHDVASVLVYQATGDEVNDVLVDGLPIMRDRVVTALGARRDRDPGAGEGEEGSEQELLHRVQLCSDELLRSAGLDSMQRRGWRSVADT